MSFRTVPIHLLLVIIFNLPFNTDTSELKPSVYIFIPVHAFSQSKVLPFTLSGIEAQDYPKNRVNIHIAFDLYQSVLEETSDHGLPQVRRNWLTYEAVKTWIGSNQNFYHEIHLDINYLEDDEDPIQGVENFWSPDRITRLSKLREIAIERARRCWADYIFYIDSDVVLVNEKTLDHLIETNLPVVSPIIWELKAITNAWDEADGRYMKIGWREKSGNFEISLAGSCVLIDLKLEYTKKIKFEGSESLDLPLGEWNGLIDSMRQNDIAWYADNEAHWGFMLPGIDRMDLEEIDLDLIDIELESSEHGLMFPVSDPMIPFIERPRKDKLGVDQVYIINLERREDRRRLMKKRAEILGTDVVFWAGVDGRELQENPAMLENIHLVEGYGNIFGAPKYGPIGCFLSHYHIFENAIENDFETIIVFEDDINFARDFNHQWYQNLEAIARHETLNHSIDLIYLGRDKRGGSDYPTGIPGLGVPRHSFGSYAYLIKRSGIDKVIASQPFDKLMPIDELFSVLFDNHESVVAMSYYPNRNLKALSIDPLLVHHAREEIHLGSYSDNLQSDFF